MKTINVNQLRDLLANVSHAIPIAFSSLTVPKLLKTGNTLGDVSKLSRVNAFTGANYERSVQRQQVREGDAPTFEAQTRQWGERIAPCLVENKGEFYLVAQIRSTRKPLYFAKRGNFRKLIDSERVKPFLPKSKPSQPVDKQVIYRNYKLSNILSMSINGEIYKVTP